MNAVFWAALGFLVVAAVWSALFVGLRGRRAWQAFTSFAAGGLAGAELLALRAEQLAVKAERTGARSAELDAAVTSLERSLRRWRILADAVAEMRAALSFLPVK